MLSISRGRPMGPIRPVWALAAIHPVWWGCMYAMIANSSKPFVWFKILPSRSKISCYPNSLVKGDRAAIIAARALATYLIPGCVGRGVRVGSESFFGGVWKSGNLEIWKFGIQQNPKNKKSQNQNPSRTKCRQGLD